MTGNDDQQPAAEEVSFDEDSIPLHRDKYLEYKGRLAGFAREKKGLESVEQDLLKSISRLLYGNDEDQNVQRVKNAYGMLTLQELRERHEEARFLSVWEIQRGKGKVIRSIPRQLEALIVLTLTLAAGMTLLTEFVWRTGRLSLLIIAYSISISVGALAALEVAKGVIKHVRETQEE